MHDLQNEGQRLVRGRQLRIGFIGNTNNYPLMVAEAFKRMGHEVIVMIDRPEPLHRPEGRYPEFVKAYPDWITDISLTATTERIVLNTGTAVDKKHLGRFDLLVLNGLGPALAYRSTAPSFCLMTGSDLTFLANWRSVPVMYRQHRPSLGLLKTLVSCGLLGLTVFRQRATLRRAFGVSYFPPGTVAEADELLDGLSVRAPVRTSFMLADVDRIQPTDLPQANPRQLAFRVFNVARLNWKEPRRDGVSALDMKGTDILLRGFALLLQQTESRVELVLVHKGMDIEATQHLVEQLGIGKHVVWLAEMSQVEVLDQYRQADVVAEQLSTSFVGMGGLDAMAAGRPVIANTRTDVKDSLLGTDSTVLHATTPAEVCAQLIRLIQSPEYHRQVASRSRDYVVARHSPQAAALKILGLYGSATGAKAGATSASGP